MKDIKFAKVVVFVNAAIPLALLGWDAYYHRLGANPLEYFTHTTGTLTLVFLLLTLAVTPLRKVFGLHWMVKLRRMIGLYAFFYGFLHLTAYVWFDKSFNFSAVAEDVWKRRFILVGMFSFFLMVPLALTSTNAMVRRLGGKRWNLLHKLVYVSAVGGVLHYWLLVKADIRVPVGFGIALSILLLARPLLKYLRQSSPKGKPSVQTE